MGIFHGYVSLPEGSSPEKKTVQARPKARESSVRTLFFW